MAHKCLVFAGCLHLFAAGCVAQTQPADYFPPPESKGGWRKLEDPQEIRRRGGMDPARLQELKQWLLDSDDRPFAAVVICSGYVVLEVERDNSSVTGVTRKSFGRDARSWSHGWGLPVLVGGEKGQGIPLDARYKPGSGGQLISFIPSLDLVLTRQTGKSGEWAYEEYVRRAATAVLPGGTK